MASRVGVNLRASAYLHQGDRKYMEDEFQVAYQRTQDKKDIEYAFFGIFDGHGGKEAAHYAKDNLMDNIVSQKLFWSENDDDILCAIKEGFMQTHMAMWKELDKWPRTASGWPSTSGTTASIAFIRRQKIYIGHVGDSGIVLGYEDGSTDWMGVSLTRDHKPESVMEMNRITECGGKVVARSGVPRVVWNRPKSGHKGPVRRSTPMDEIPFLAVARSLGDLWSYNASQNEFVVSPEPDVCVVDIDVSNYRCLIFGTDGLWNALSPSVAVEIAYNSEKNNEKHHLGLPLESGKARNWVNPSLCIVTGALERYRRVGIRADNTSAVTVFLDPPGRPKREVLQEQMAKKPTGLSPKTPSPANKKTKAASVKVHVYKQNATNVPVPSEGQGTLYPLKERVPNPTSWFLLPYPKSDVGPTSTTVIGSTEPQKNKCCSTEGSENCCCCCPQRNGNTGSSVNSEHTQGVRLRPNQPLPSNTNKDDDIQIPLVSSSCTSSSDENSENCSKRCTSAGAKSKSEVTSSSSVVSPRRTRSFFTLPPLSSQSNVSTVNVNPSSDCSSLNVNDRILKNVNRSAPNIHSASPSSKRKRPKELFQEDRLTKSVRIHTRSHVFNRKPMVTRSQEKRRAKKPKPH